MSNRLLEAAGPNPAVGQAGDGVDQMAQGAAQSVQFPDDQGVAGPQLVQIRSWPIETGTWRLIETRTRDHRGTDAVLGFFGKTMELTAGTFGGGGA